MEKYTNVPIIADDEYFDENEIQKAKDKLKRVQMGYIQEDLEKILSDIKTKGYSEKDGFYIQNLYIKKNIFKSFCEDNNLRYTYLQGVYTFKKKL